MRCNIYHGAYLNVAKSKSEKFSLQEKILVTMCSDRC